MNYEKLKDKLENMTPKPKQKMIDPLKGLKGELRRKMLANLAGHRSGAMTEEEDKEIKRIQSKYNF
jgi:hypothetical protein